MILFHFLCFISSSASNDCLSYECKIRSKTSLPCEVFSPTSQNYILSPCLYSYECLFQLNTTVSCTAPATGTRYPGDYCYSSLDCISINCTNNVCQGSSLNSTCLTSADCNPGLYCELSACVEQKIIGSYCVYSEECINSCYCDLNMCIEIGSLSIGAFTNNLLDGRLSVSCSTGFATTYNSTHLQCAKAPVSNPRNFLKPCQSSTCSDLSGTVFKQCICGYDGNSYCPYFEGDYLVQKSFQNWNEFFNTSMANCSTLNRWGYACFYTQDNLTFSSYLSWTNTFSDYLNYSYPLLYTGSTCIQKALSTDLVNLKNQQNYFRDYISSCPIYECVLNPPNWEENQCTMYTENIYSTMVYPVLKLKKCQEGTFCKVTLNSNSTCSRISENFQRHPGEFCNNDDDCISNNCSFARCIGAGENMSCVEDECNPGLWCNLTVCQLILSTLEGCKSDIQCGTYSVCFNSSCYRKFTLRVGELSMIDDPTQQYGFSSVCASGFAVTNSSNQTYCEVPPVYPSYKPIKCLSGTPCYDSTGQYEKTCQCRYTNFYPGDLNGCCPPFEGDTNLQTAIANFQILADSSIQCYSGTGPTALCYKFNKLASLYYAYYFTNFTYYQNKTQIEFGEICIQEHFFSEFWESLLFILTFKSRPPEICYNYDCVNSLEQYQDNRICLFKDKLNKVIYLSTCFNSMACQEFIDDTIGICMFVKYSRTPGEYCWQDSDCITKLCENHICQGLNQPGLYCHSSEHTSPGLFCNVNTKRTEYQISIGGNCNTTEECMNSLSCDNYTCVKMFSLPLNSLTKAIENSGLAISCQSGFALLYKNGFYKCVAPPVRKISGLNVCGPGNICFANDSTVSKACVCAYDGNAYCPLFEGDDEVQTMIADWIKLFDISEANCNTLGRYSYACFANLGKQTLQAYLNWSLNAEKYFNNSWLLETSPSYCVQSIFLSDYTNTFNQLMLIGGNKTQCPIYYCDAHPITAGEDECLIYQNNIFFNNLIEISFINNQCSLKGQYCLPQPSQTLSCSPAPLNLPGESCTVSSDCSSANCTNLTCIGSSQGSNCSVLECNKGLYCDDKEICQVVKQDLENCNSTTECSTYSVCRMGRCLKMYSLAIGEVSEVEDGGEYGYSVLCNSGFAQISINGTVCEIAPVSNSQNFPIYCTPGWECFDHTSKYSKSCQCGFDQNGYCPTFEGDLYLVNAISNLQKLSALNIECSSINRLTYACFSSNSTALRYFLYYSTNLTNYLQIWQLINNTYCIQEVFTREYWAYFTTNNIKDPDPAPTPIPIHSYSWYLSFPFFFFFF